MFRVFEISENSLPVPNRFRIAIRELPLGGGKVLNYFGKFMYFAV